jgi:hypothetical protein
MALIKITKIIKPAAIRISMRKAISRLLQFDLNNTKRRSSNTPSMAVWVDISHCHLRLFSLMRA